MKAATNGDDEGTQSSARKREKGLPTYISLAEALDIIGQIYEKGGGDLSSDMLAEVVGNSPASSFFRMKVGALKNFGLAEEQNGHLRLTELGKQIVAPKEATEIPLAKQRALLNVALYKELYEKFRGKALPDEQFLANMLHRDFQISASAKDRAASIFIESGKAAGLFVQSGGTLQVGEPAALRHDAADTLAAMAGATSSSEPQPSGSHVLTIALGRGRIARIVAPGDLTAAEAVRLKKALDVLIGE